MVMSWKPVYGYEKYYSVSDCGQVRSEARTINRKDGGKGNTQRLKERILSICRNGKGYYCFPASKNGNRKNIDVHRAVFEAHVRPLKTGEHVHHMDSNRENNHIENLQALSGYDHRVLTQKRIRDKCDLADFLTILFVTS